MTHAVPDRQLHAAYDLARERYAAIGVDTDAALDRLRQIPISLLCWLLNSSVSYSDHESSTPR